MREHFLPPLRGLGVPLSKTASSPVELDEQRLVLASKGGDQDAFAQLVQRYQRRIFNLVYRMLQHYEEANEITQETFLAAWQGLPSFRGEARFATWLYRITYHCCLRQLERRRRERDLQAIIQAEHMLDGINKAQRTEDMLELRDRQAVVLDQLAQLPPKYRSVLVLRHLQEMTYEEMADSLSMPIGTIKTHLFRARNLLKERLLTLSRLSPA